MARKLFFSFHFQRDAWRAGQIRNSDLIPNEDEYGFIDSVDWEEVKRKGDKEIERWINSQLEHTSVTVVLIGAETADRYWVDFELRQSWERGNALVGIWIHNVKDSNCETDIKGENPLDSLVLIEGKPLSSIFKTYDWVLDDGRNNLGTWAEEAVKIREGYNGELKLKKRGSDTSVNNTVSNGPLIIRNPAKPWSC